MHIESLDIEFCAACRVSGLPRGCAGGRVFMGPHLKLHEALKGAAGVAQLSMAAHLHNAALAHHCTHADRRRAVNMQSEVHGSHSVLPCTCNGISVDNGAEAMRDDDGRAVLQDGRCTVITAAGMASRLDSCNHMPACQLQ